MPNYVIFLHNNRFLVVHTRVKGVQNMNNSGVEFVHYGADAVTQTIRKEANINEEIAKQAKKHELSKIKIANVVHTANHTLNNYLRKTASDKCYTMEKYQGPASVEKVLEFLPKTKTASAPAVVTNSQEAAFNLINWSPTIKEGSIELPEQEIDVEGFVKEAREDFERFLMTTDRFIKEKEHRYGEAMSKLASIASELKDVLEHELMYGESFANIKEACMRKYKDESTATLFNKIEAELLKTGKYSIAKKYGLVTNGNQMKTVDEKTGLKANMDIMFVDGNHPIMKLMDEFGSLKDKSKELYEDIDLGREAKEQLVKKIIVLDTPDKIKKYEHEHFLDAYKGVVKDMESKMNVKTSGVRQRFFSQKVASEFVGDKPVISGSNPGKNRVLTKPKMKPVTSLKAASLSNELFWMGSVSGEALGKTAFLGGVARAIGGGLKSIKGGIGTGLSAIKDSSRKDMLGGLGKKITSGKNSVSDAIFGKKETAGVGDMKKQFMGNIISKAQGSFNPETMTQFAGAK